MPAAFLPHLDRGRSGPAGHGTSNLEPAQPSSAAVMRAFFCREASGDHFIATNRWDEDSTNSSSAQPIRSHGRGRFRGLASLMTTAALLQGVRSAFGFRLPSARSTGIPSRERWEMKAAVPSRRRRRREPGEATPSRTGGGRAVRTPVPAYRPPDRGHHHRSGWSLVEHDDHACLDWRRAFGRLFFEAADAAAMPWPSPPGMI